jgi:hypothetical protein
MTQERDDIVIALYEELAVCELSFRQECFSCDGVTGHTADELNVVQDYFDRQRILYDLGVHDQLHWS